MARKSYYVTTTLPYVNADPHVGFALEVIRADCLARLHRGLGDDVFYNAGSDEHGQKIYQKAIEAKKTPLEYADEYAAKFARLKEALNLSYDKFIRTTDPEHERAAQEFWKICNKNGFIYKANYNVKYCVGCELEKTDSELAEGKCEFHPSLEIEFRREKNYFFAFSKFEDDLRELYENNPQFVVPNKRLKEILNFVNGGLKDFSISRLKSKMPWGIPVPGDNKHVMFVWFDALVNYISTLGWPDNIDNFHKYWGTKDQPNGIQLAGKDNLRQQSAMWQAMLLAVKLPLSKQIFIGDFIFSGGQRMSKSLGNVVNPFDYVEKYGTDSLRYFLLAKIHPFEDSDFTQERFEGAYQADLANGLGNLIARVEALCEKNKMKLDLGLRQQNSLLDDVALEIEKYRFDEALGLIWSAISGLDKYINRERVWKLELSEANQRLSEIVVGTTALSGIIDIAEALEPFLPETSREIQDRFSGPKITKGEPLFPRL